MSVRSKLVDCVNKAMINSQASLLNNKEDTTFEVRPACPDRVIIRRVKDGVEYHSERHQSYENIINNFIHFMNGSSRGL